MNKKLAHPALCASLVLTCALTFAQTGARAGELAPGFHACIAASAGATEQMEKCGTAAWQHWDDILNKNYKKLRTSCAGQPRCDALQKAERLWIQYRDATEGLIWDFADGGSMGRLDAIAFKAEETGKQARILAELAGDTTGNSAPGSEATTDSATTDTAQGGQVTAAAMQGEWFDQYSGRCRLQIVRIRGNELSVSVEWADGAMASAIWRFSGQWDAASGTLAYRDGMSARRETQADTHIVTEKPYYFEGTGELRLQGDTLLWHDGKEDRCAQCVFKRTE